MSRRAAQQHDAPPLGMLLGRSAWMIPAFIPNGEWVWVAFALLPFFSGRPVTLLWLPVVVIANIVSGREFSGTDAATAQVSVWVLGMLLALALNPGVLRHVWARTLIARQTRSKRRRAPEPVRAADRTPTPVPRAAPAADAVPARQAALTSVASVLSAAVAVRAAETAALGARLAAPTDRIQIGGAGAAAVGVAAAAAAPLWPWQVEPVPATGAGVTIAAAGDEPVEPVAAAEVATPDAAPTPAVASDAADAAGTEPGDAELGPGISVIPQTTIYNPDAGS